MLSDIRLVATKLRRQATGRDRGPPLKVGTDTKGSGHEKNGNFTVGAGHARNQGRKSSCGSSGDRAIASAVDEQHQCGDHQYRHLRRTDACRSQAKCYRTLGADGSSEVHDALIHGRTAKRPRISRSSSRPNMNYSSTSKLRRSLVSTFPLRCLSVPTR